MKSKPPRTAATDSYRELLDGIKSRVRTARVKAALSVNRDLILMYWGIGRDILDRQNREGWGAKVVARLASDLRREFPEMRGLSRANLLYMRAFAEAYPDEAIVQQAVGQIPWGHNLALLAKLKDRDARLWYARQTIEHGWSRNVLVHQIESDLHRRSGQALTNFTKTLPVPQSDLAHQLIKDPYAFDFLRLGEDADERTLEKGLVEHIQKFLLELGVGFAFVGQQVHLEVGNKDFYLDLLFYHVRLRCYIAEYALRDASKPIGVSAYKLTEALPGKLKNALPTIKQIESELGAHPSKSKGPK